MKYQDKPGFDLSDMKITDGTSQDDRYNGALDDDYFHVDELGFESLLSMGAGLAGQIDFIGGDNQKAGNWESLFTNDETVIISMIGSFDLRSAEEMLIRRLRENPGLSGNYYLETCGIVYSLAVQIDFWFSRLMVMDAPPAENLRRKIEGIIHKKLIDDLHLLGLFLLVQADGSISKLKLHGYDFSSFSHIWKISEDQYSAPLFTEAELMPLKDVEKTERFIKDRFYSFYNAILVIKKSAEHNLAPSLVHKRHDPSTGLYIAFLKLFMKSQKRLNKFKKRHLDFYYHDVLQAKPRSFISDKVFVTLESDGSKKNVLVKEKSPFIAGKDENSNELIYASETDLLVNSARVEKLYTLFLEHNELISPERELEFVTGAKWNEPVVTDLSGSGFPVFGAAKNAAKISPAVDAETGFAVASPVLFLSEGERFVKITLDVRCFSEDKKKKLRHIVKTLGELLDTDKNDAVNKAFKDSFNIALTTETSWYDVNEYYLTNSLIDGGIDDNCIIVSFRLSAEVESVVAFNSEIHGEQFNTELPVLLFTVNNDAYVNPFSLFQDLVFERIRIEVDVRDVKNLNIYNNHGQLSPGSPFYIFGPLPSTGAFFIAGNWEVSRKYVTGFNLNIEWGGLPENPGGFESYYREYENDVDTDSFKARVAILKDGKWFPREETQQKKVPLFEENRQSILKKNICIDGAGFEFCKPSGQKIREDQFAYGVKTKSGFFKFTLDEPDGAFGHDVYPMKLAGRLAANARIKKAFKKKMIPPKPYSPLVNSITADYSAETIIDLENRSVFSDDSWSEKVFHIFPKGSELIYPGNSGRDTFLIPVEEFDGNLYIGISGENIAGILTLFFHMNDDSLLNTDTLPPVRRWFYLSSNRWLEFRNFDVLTDSTNGFLSSGIITLNIPPDINTDNTIMPEGLYWLRVSAQRPKEGRADFQRTMRRLCSLNSVTPHAVMATFQNKENSLSHLEKGLPAGSITQLKSSLAGIGKIRQTTSGFGGATNENSLQMCRRFSERLRHKNRASVPYDYERMILQKFPEIFKVKCFSNMTSENLCRPGHVLIVVIPFVNDKAASLNNMSMVNSLVLREIKSFCEKFSSPFVRLEVRNPVYEKVQVRCSVRFKSGKAGGYYVKKLNHDINDYLSPWCETGYQAKFGWRVRYSDIESYIQQLDYTDYVTNLSMLHIVDDGTGHFEMEDTVNGPADYGQYSDGEIKKIIDPEYPWSIMIPVQHHFIETTESQSPIRAEVTGVNELEVGSTLIIRGDEDGDATETE